MFCLAGGHFSKGKNRAEKRAAVWTGKGSFSKRYSVKMDRRPRPGPMPLVVKIVPHLQAGHPRKRGSRVVGETGGR